MHTMQLCECCIRALTMSVCWLPVLSQVVTLLQMGVLTLVEQS